MADTIGRHNSQGRRGGRLLLHSLNPTSKSLVTALISLSQEVAVSNASKVCQRRNTSIIKRRVSTLCVLFEEVRDLGIILSPSVLLSFQKLLTTLHAVRVLLDDCSERSCLWLLLDHETYSKRFHQLSQDIGAALDDLPLDLLDVSDDVREQVKLAHQQARKSKIVIDPKEEQLRLEVFSVMRKFVRKATPDPAKLKTISQILHLNHASDCHTELTLLEQEIERQTNGQAIYRITSLISFVRYCKCILYGVVEVEEISSSRTLQNGECGETDRDTLIIPEDFKCPISLDLMRDPVILASGQTYDKSSITMWIQEGNSTCPKTGLKLLHTALIPNYALRSLIGQWCQDHNVPFDTTKKSNKSAAVDSISRRAALEATRMTVTFLVETLSVGSLEVQRQVAYELRLLSKCGMDNRMCIGEAGAIPHLISLLSTDDSKLQENVVTALLNLSIYEGNKSLIVNAGGLDPIVKVLTSGVNIDSRENAAATLFSLSVADEYKVAIGSKPEAISGLVQLLSEGSPRGQRDAVAALFNICIHYTNRSKVVNAGAVPFLVQFLSSDMPPLVEDALAVLTVLAGSPEGLAAINQSSAIPTLARLLTTGSSRGKEKSICVLLGLCRYGGDKTIESVSRISSMLASLHALLNTGTPRARRKAGCVLRILQKWD